MKSNVRIIAKVICIVLLSCFSALILLNALLGVGETRLVEGTNTPVQRLLALGALIAALASFALIVLAARSNRHLHYLLATFALLAGYVAFIFIRGFDASMDGAAFGVMALIAALSRVATTKF